MIPGGPSVHRRVAAVVQWPRLSPGAFVFDTSSGVPVVVHRQDVSNLGWALGKQVRNNLIAAK